MQLDDVAHDRQAEPEAALPDGRVALANRSNTYGRSSAAMPRPVSLTEMRTPARARSTRTSMCPPSGVNLTAFERRFQTTC